MRYTTRKGHRVRPRSRKVHPTGTVAKPHPGREIPDQLVQEGVRPADNRPSGLRGRLARGRRGSPAGRIDAEEFIYAFIHAERGGLPERTNDGPLTLGALGSARPISRRTIAGPLGSSRASGWRGAGARRRSAPFVVRAVLTRLALLGRHVLLLPSAVWSALGGLAHRVPATATSATAGEPMGRGLATVR